MICAQDLIIWDLIAIRLPHREAKYPRTILKNQTTFQQI